jgi:hypothetical protein
MGFWRSQRQSNAHYSASALLPTAYCQLPLQQLPLCSFTHHHSLKRRLTPARDELVRVHCSTIAARGGFSSDGKTDLSARRGPGVVCCMSNAAGTGGRRQCLPT